MLPYNVTLVTLDFLFYASILLTFQSIYFTELLLYINDVVYQLSVLLVTNWDKSCALLFYNAYVGVVTTAILPWFLYDLGQIYWFEDKFEYTLNPESTISASFELIAGVAEPDSEYI